MVDENRLRGLLDRFGMIISRTVDDDILWEAEHSRPAKRLLKLKKEAFLATIRHLTENPPTAKHAWKEADIKSGWSKLISCFGHRLHLRPPEKLQYGKLDLWLAWAKEQQARMK